ncbi:MAG: sulfite exporter TauE/SafE family protein [Gemmatimonadota bacterium]|nr:sulfite exporter TauE/SafE family protein [Gemmatimonadota bacterium]
MIRAMTLPDALFLFTAAVGGGALNAVAGGGSLLTFPTLLFHGVPAVPANASSAVALMPGSLASTAAYRDDLRSTREYLPAYTLSSLLGGLLGAVILLYTPGAAFQALVPWLMLLATLLFAFGGSAVRRLREGRDPGARARSRLSWAAGFLTQLVIATYGGFFGGGMGIMMLATFTAVGMEDIHAMNALKSWCAVCINAVAVVTFVAAGIVSWPQTLVMLAGAVVGGYAGAASAKRVDPVRVRRFVIVLGAVLTAYFFIQG